MTVCLSTIGRRTSEATKGVYGSRERETHGLLVDGLGALNIGEEIGQALAERLHAIEGEDDVLCRKRIAAWNVTTSLSVKV